MSKEEVRARTRGRRRLSAAARRELIERAATEVFAERGYAGASIDEIARRSGVTPPVVYDHFASKLALFTRLLERRATSCWRCGWRSWRPAPPAVRRAR